MRTLFVSFLYPWPEHSGWAIRLANTVDALLRLGDVDFVCLDSTDRLREPAPEGVRMIEIPEGPSRSTREWALRWIRSDLPREILRRDFETAARQIPGALDGPYDAVIVPYIHAFPAIADFIPAPVILDLPDLADWALRSRREARFRTRSTSWMSRSLKRARWEAVTLADRVDERRFARLQDSAAARCERVFVCSETDMERTGFPNAVLIPNGYERSGAPRDSCLVTDVDAPVFVFVAGFTYQPNIDAVRWFVSRILPRIRQSIPGARFRVVGDSLGVFEDLAHLPGVEIVGWVPEVAPEIVGADVVVVPLLVGSGTRLKVLEAMAYRVPIVSTPIGCEGIDVINGEHLLISAAAEDFADAAIRLVTEEDLRAAVVDAAEERYLEQYRWSTIKDRIATAVLEVANAGDRDGQA